MSRKGKKRQQQKAKRPPKPQFSLGRYYRHYRQNFHQIFKWAAIGAGAIAIVAVAVIVIGKSGTSRTKAELIRLARRDFVLGHADHAVLNYHQAENVDPTDKELKAETAMARAFADMMLSGRAEQPLATAQSLLSNDSTVAVAHAGLAQLYQRLSNPQKSVNHAYAALRFASADNDTPTVMAASMVLESYFRHMDMLDSAAKYGEQSVSLAATAGDATNLIFAEAGAGMTFLKQGNQERARLLFEDVLAKVPSGSAVMVGLGKTGMAEYYFATGKLDSAAALAREVVGSLTNTKGSEVFARANYILGRTLKAQGDLPGAVSNLTSSLSAFASMGLQSELVDNLNDLASTYLLQKDYFNARKHLYVAARLADKYKFVGKDHYDADMNVRFLSYLSQDEYLRAAREGDELIRQYSVWTS